MLSPLAPPAIEVVRTSRVCACARRRHIAGTAAGLLASGILLASAPAGAAPYDIDTAHTSIYFAVAHRDVSFVRGRFQKVAARVDFDPDAKTGTIVVDVDPASVDTGNETLDGVLRSAQFLGVETYPGVRFVSQRLVFDGGMLATVEGSLFLHGVQRPATLTADRFVCRDLAFGLVRQHVCGGAFHATLKRSEFGMTRFAADVGDDVRLEINVEGVRK
jgi:polyisoprenoid-binding protein YceI